MMNIHLILILVALALMSGCQSPRFPATTAPTVSTAALGNRIDSISTRAANIDDKAVIASGHVAAARSIADRIDYKMTLLEGLSR